jgi:hypothetical protein
MNAKDAKVHEGKVSNSLLLRQLWHLHETLELWALPAT